jgi:hypothetical protein
MTLLVRQVKRRASAAQRGFPGSEGSSDDHCSVLALVVPARLAPGGRPEPNFGSQVYFFSAVEVHRGVQRLQEQLTEGFVVCGPVKDGLFGKRQCRHCWARI